MAFGGRFWKSRDYTIGGRDSRRQSQRKRHPEKEPALELVALLARHTVCQNGYARTATPKRALRKRKAKKKLSASSSGHSKRRRPSRLPRSRLPAKALLFRPPFPRLTRKKA